MIHETIQVMRMKTKQQSTRSRYGRLSFGRASGCAAGVCLLFCCVSLAGCGPAERTEGASESAEGLTIHIDRNENGAAFGSGGEAAGPRIAIRRRLAFEVSGMAPTAPAGASHEQRAAARQAAIIDAFGKALIEARRSRGQSVADFTAKLGRRLTVVHRTVGTGDEIEVRLIARGVQKVFIARDGVLQHLPHDVSLVRKIFDESNGEFSLLPADEAVRSDVCVAKVGCYVPVAMEGALAGGISAEGDQVDEP